MRNKSDVRTGRPMRWMLRHFAFLGVAVLLISFAAVPLMGMRTIWQLLEGYHPMPGETEIRGTLARYMTNQLSDAFFFSPLRLEMVCLLFGAIGFGSAMILSSHLFSRKQAMLMASLPVKKGKDWLMRLGCFAILVLLPMTLSLLLHPLLAWINGLGRFMDLGLYLPKVAGSLLIVLYGYALGSLCAQLCGTVWSAALLGLCLALALEGLTYAALAFAGAYLQTMPAGVVKQAIGSLSPIYGLYKYLYSAAEGHPVPGILAIALFLIASFHFCRHSRPERSGRTLSQKTIELPGTVLLTILGGAVGGVMCLIFFASELGLFLGICLGCAAVWLATRMLVDQSVRPSLRTWPIPLACLTLVCAAVLGLRMDVMGYNQYLPAAGEVTAVSFHAFGSDEQTLRFEEREQIETLLSWAEVLRDETLARRADNPFTIYSDKTVSISYEKDGKITRRAYTLPEDQAKALPYLKKLVASDAYHAQRTVPVLPNVSVSCALYTHGLDRDTFKEVFGFSIRKPEWELLSADAVREALEKDLADETVESMQKPVICTVNFEGYDSDVENWRYSENYKIREDDVNTLQLLLGDDTQQWIDYANGAYMDSEDMIAFLCIRDDKGFLTGYRRASSPEEAKQWLSGVTYCSNDLYREPLSRLHVAVYSLTRLEKLSSSGYSFGSDGSDLDLEDLDHLPEQNAAHIEFAIMDGMDFDLSDMIHPEITEEDWTAAGWGVG